MLLPIFVISVFPWPRESLAFHDIIDVSTVVQVLHVKCLPIQLCPERDETKLEMLVKHWPVEFGKHKEGLMVGNEECDLLQE